MCDNTKRLLNIAAVVDAFHDFTKRYDNKKTHNQIKNDIISAINIDECIELNDISSYTKYDPNGENEFLKDCIKGIDFNDIDSLVDTIIANDFYSEFEMPNGNMCEVRILHKDKKVVHFETDAKLYNLSEDDVINFIDNTSAGYHIFDILADASTIRFLRGIQTIRDLNKLNINMVINRERIIDAASKPTSNLNFVKSIFDVTQTDVIYDNKSEFNTKYNLILEPLKPLDSILTKKLSSVFKIKMGNTILCNSEGDYRAFTAKNCAMKITNESDINKRAAYYQAKRAGDWLQALSIYNKREYKTQDWNIHESYKTLPILLTSDRILLAYSILLPQHVLFLTRSNILLFFEPTSSKFKAKSNAKPAPKAGEKHKRNNSNVVVVNNNSNVVVVNNNSNNNSKAKRAKYQGGSSNRLQNYYKELAETIEGFDNDEDLDYDFYENVACTVLACAKVFQPDELESIFFKTLPSVEGYIRTDNENLVGFFKGDKYSADCISFAARQVALGSLGLRTGTLTSLSEKHIDIHPMASGAYDAVYSALPKDFGKRQMHIIKMIGELQHVVERHVVHNVQQPLHNTHHKTIRRNNRRHVIRHTTRKSRSG
jgi:hypothetical protein